MNKKIKGYEVMKLIAENKIKEGQEFILMIRGTLTKYRICWTGKNFCFCDTGTFVLRENTDINFILGDLEILEDEDEEEIEIENIGELPEDFDASFYDKHSIKANRYKINEILRAVKQLDKKINK